MAPLLPSECSAYSLTLPEDVDDDRLNLKVRTGAALTYTRSSLVVHGGLTVGLSLSRVVIPEIRKELDLLQISDLSPLISTEFFYLNLSTRKWIRLDLSPSQIRPQPRFFHSVVFHDHFIYLFGGLILDENDEIVPANDLWEFDINTNEWVCLDDGYTSGTVYRYDTTLLVSHYTSPTDGTTKLGLIIAGGKGQLNEELNPLIIFDLEKKQFIPTTIMELTLTENIITRNLSTSSEVDPKLKDSDIIKNNLKLSSESNFIITSSDAIAPDGEHSIYILDPPKENEMLDELKNPLLEIPVVPRAGGLRLPMADMNRNKKIPITPNKLKYPSGGIFGPNVIIGGLSKESNEFEVYLFNKPSKKWTRLSIDSRKNASELYLWKCYSWSSHHKVLVLGSLTQSQNVEFNTVQTFDLALLVALPISNLFHTFTDSDSSSKSSPMKPATSFEEYSKYISPTTKISSIRSVFPNYAMTLGRNAFERYGPSLSDFEFVTTEGDKVNTPLMLLRKRWGRCFDMLLAKGYARAVHTLESKKTDIDNDADDSDNHSLKSNSTSKRSIAMMSSSTPENTPLFRLPFQDSPNGSPAPPNLSSNLPDLQDTRKDSIVSIGNLSITSSSTNGGGIINPNEIELDSIPAQLPFPSEPLPHLDSKVPLKSMASRDFRDSPRGSVSGNSLTSVLTSQQSSKLKELRSSLTLKKLAISRSSSIQTTTQEELNLHGSNLESITDIEEATATLLEPLLIPRSLYLPFSTSTVQAFSEYLFTGQLGDKWLLHPTTTDNFLMAKFYEVPLLYDLIAEVLYAIIGKKEDALIKEFGSLTKEYDERVIKLFGNDETLINEFYEEHPHICPEFKEMEDLLNAADDGYLNVSLLRKASKVSSGSTSTSRSTPRNRQKLSFDEQSKSLFKSPGRIGRSSRSKEVHTEGEYYDDDEDDIEDNEDEGEDSQMDIDIENKPRALTTDDIMLDQKNSPFFKTDTLTASSKRHSASDSIDPITPLTRSRSAEAKFVSKYSALNIDSDDQKAIDEAEVIDGRRLKSPEPVLDADDPLSSVTNNSDMSDGVGRLVNPVSNSRSRKPGSVAIDFQVPEGRFELPKEKISKVYTTASSSDKQKESATSDSDDLAVGLGLVEKPEKVDRTFKSIGSIRLEEEGEAVTELPTLERLAAQNAPPPPLHLLQIVYEAAALACDMKLLLRAMNVIEMAKSFESKKSNLLTELEDFEAQFNLGSLEDKEDAIGDFQIKDSIVGEAQIRHHRNSLESGREEHDNTDASLRSFSLKSTFSNLKSASSANLKTVPKESEISRHSRLNPFTRKKTSEDNKRGLISSLISKTSKK